MASRGRVAGAPRAAPRRPPAHDGETRDGRRRRWRESGVARACRAHPDRCAAALLALFVFALLWPALLGFKILSPIALLYDFAPWQGARPADVRDYYNSLLVDIPMADYPWRLLARDLIHSGTFPAWNPHAFTGIPLFNNPQVGLFTPFNLPLWILPLNYALGLSAAIKLWVGGFGAYLLVRRLGPGFLAGLVAGVSFAFCSLNVVWLTHETLPAVAVMAPWAFLLVERLLAGDGRLGSVLGLAAVIAIGLGGGHPGMQVHLLAVVALYAGLRCAVTREVAGRERLRRLALVGGGLALGTLVMGIMLAPELLSSRGTLGTAARQGEDSTTPGSFMPLGAIRSVVVPDWWGRSSATELWPASRTDPAVVNFNERTFYAGTVALLLALTALLVRGAWRRKLPFVVLAAIGLAVPLQAPGLHWFVTHVPPFELIQNQRIHFVFALSVAVLAAFGLQAMIDAPRERMVRLLVPFAAIVLGIALFVSVDATGAELDALLDHFVTGADTTTEAIVEPESAAGHVIRLTSVVWLLLFAVGVGLSLLAACRWPRARIAIACGLVLLAAVDMYRFADGYQPMGPEAEVIPPVTPAISYLQSRSDEGRVTALDYTLTHNYALRYGLRDVRGYDPPQPTIRYFNLWQVASPAQENWRPFTLSQVSPAMLNAIGLLGARFLVTEPTVDLTGVPGVRLAFEGTDARVWRNARAVPRTMVAPEILVSDGEESTLAGVGDPSFDPRRAVIVEGDEEGAASLSSGARGSARVVDERNARVTIAAQLDRRGLVVLNDQLTDGWSVEVDGRPAEIVRVNNVMRGVVVDAGRHEIVWSYAVPGLRLGAALTAAGLLVFAVGGVVLVRRRRHPGR